MKAAHTIELNEWVVKNSGQLKSGEFKTIKSMATHAQSDLGFKVPPSAFRDILQVNGIDTKRVSESKRQELAFRAEIDRLNQEIKQLKHALAKVASAEFVPEDLKDFVFAGLSEEVRQALATN